MKIGLLTGGGDCPGLNAAIYAVVNFAETEFDAKVVGFMEGWRGFILGNSVPLDCESVRGIASSAGTILRTSRTNPAATADGLARCKKTYELQELDALIAIGGDDTLTVAAQLVAVGLSVIGIPKTIDNDIKGTEMTIGFTTAVSVAAEAIARVRSTAAAHGFVMIVEVMGRSAGWIALESGIAACADIVLLPELPISISELIYQARTLSTSPRKSAVIVIAEGCKVGDETHMESDTKPDAFGHVRPQGAALRVASAIKSEFPDEVRTLIVGHVQRGAEPVAFDRALATEFGIMAVQLAHNRQSGMVCLQDGKVRNASLSSVLQGTRFVPKERLELFKKYGLLQQLES